MPDKYNIVRYYFKDEPRMVKRNVTLEEAQAHCSDPRTERPGKWFDGYERAWEEIEQ